jgi:nucleoside 2-deoxyribosyltransferase
MKVYLCGPILGCSDDECKNWREKATFEFDEVIDPMRRDYRGREEESYKEIVELDKKDILECDVVLVNFPKPSVGTSMEVLFAWEQHKPIVVLTSKDVQMSPWMRYHASKICYHISDAIKFINFYGQIIKAKT